MHAAKTITYLTEKLALPSGNQLVLMLTAAISEAMLNVKHHAYEYERSIFTGILEHRWWQYALFDEDESRFIFLIYDLGLGILKSYKATVEPSMADNHILEEALSVGGSRFRHDEPWRGNGSEDLKHPIDIGETLLICCDDMRYVYRGAGQPTTIERTPFLVSGNLIEWTLETEVKKEGT
ncbi:hypothetical protein AO721_04480 [Aeromonas veronii]|nr:hypothetical protein AO728_03685 [Aeromonas veronii]KRV78706.1 hypothetical protein AO719_04295 [Aeromonas veronii]KRV89909.1 hypothetical protein AO721_04480 [Aeromonas veronii]KRV91644.1 hypothetical protein AO739_03750 [Aeromonas veronii]